MQKKFKILLSAYACEPNRGSEPGVGWNWSIELAKLGHEVCVLTRANNKIVIDEYFRINDRFDNLSFEYYDLPAVFLKLKKYGLSVNLYYFLWLLGVVKKAKQLHKSNKFDLSHHLTFGVFRHPSFLYKLGLPHIFGPVGGGEHTPQTLKSIFNYRNVCPEIIRNFINSLSRYNIILHKVYEKSLIVFTKTEQTKEFIPKRFYDKVVNYLEIGIDDVISQIDIDRKIVFRVLYVGRLIPLKGLDIALAAYSIFLDSYEGESEFILIGSGDYQKKIKLLSIKYAIQDKVKIIDWMTQEDLKSYYKSSSVLLFPSLHDSSGNVVLEALSFGLPVVCLDCGGPAAVVGDEFSKLISQTENVSREEIEQSLANSLLLLAKDENVYSRYSIKAIERANQLTWTNTVKSAYVIVAERLNNNRV